MLRLTGEPPARVAEMRRILESLGLDDAGCGRPWIAQHGLWDHGELWARSGRPVLLVGHPYELSVEQATLLVELRRRFRGLRVAVDDRPSHHGFGTRHVRVELVEVRRPFDSRSVPSIRATRAYARAARAAFAEAFAERPQHEDSRRCD